MKTTVVSHQDGTVCLQIDIDISGSMLAVEERIQNAVKTWAAQPLAWLWSNSIRTVRR